MGGCTDEPHRRLLLASRTPTSRRGRPMSTTQTQTTDTDIDTALKAKHRAMWALGDYHAVATEIIPALGPVLVDAAGITAGERVLDVAAGGGHVAHPAPPPRGPGGAAHPPPPPPRQGPPRPPAPRRPPHLAGAG